MKTCMRAVTLATVLLIIPATFAQDGDLLTSSGAGRGWFETVPLFSGGPLVAPANLTIGTAPLFLSTLNVRGDQMPVTDAFSMSLCTFRTDVTANNQNWSMVRSNSEVGRLWHSNPSTAFNVQAMQGPLRLRNAASDGIRINGNTATTLNSFTNNIVGYGAIGHSATMDVMSPNSVWARWHLVHDLDATSPTATVPIFGFRPWMRNGVIGTGNSDLFYMGHKYAMTGGTGAEENDNSNMVAAWGDDELPAGYGHMYDNYTFRYVGTLSAGNSAGSIEGLEIMRLRPFRRNPGDRIEGFVGIGDWVNSAQMPEQRLDVMNGLVRIRQLPTDLEMTSATKAMVVDATGVVGWRTFPTGGGTDCRWALNNVNNLITATSWSGLCVGQDRLVGIGIAGPTAKLHVVHTPSASGGYIALTSNLVASGSSADDNYSIVGGVTGSGRNVRGVQGNAFSNGSSSTQLIGVEGSAYDATGVAASTIGVNADARSGTNTQQVFGVKAFTAGGSSTSRAGFFQGHLAYGNAFWAFRREPQGQHQRLDRCFGRAQPVAAKEI